MKTEKTKNDLSRFAKKTSMVVFLFFSWFIVEGVFFPNSFARRPWEALKFNVLGVNKSYFYPNQHLVMSSQGDLAFNPEHVISLEEEWITDRMGYRNDTLYEKSDIIILGDSFIAGALLTQEDLLSNKMLSKTETPLTIQNIAPGTFYHYDYFIKRGFIKKPKTIIYSLVERSTPPPLLSASKLSKMGEVKQDVIALMQPTGINIFFDKILRHYSILWGRSRVEELKTGSKGGYQSKVNEKMYFLNGVNQAYTDESFERYLSRIKEYHEFCEKQGIAFVFLPMPNKETVYYEEVPFDTQPGFLLKLDSLLRDSGIKTVNTLKLYNDYRKTHNESLYHLDDSHWNPLATGLVADEVLKVLNEK